MKDRTHVVFLVGHFYPNATAGGRCIGNIAGCIKEECDVTVICFPDGDFLDWYPSSNWRDVNFVHIDDYVVSRAVSFRSLKNTIGHKMEMGLGLIDNMLSNAGLRMHLVNSYLKALHALDSIDLLVTTCNPFESVYAGSIYCTESTKTKGVAILFDPFSESRSVVQFKNKQRAYRQALAHEKEALSKYDKIFEVGWTSHIASELPDVCSVSEQVEIPNMIPVNLGSDSGCNLDFKVSYLGALGKRFRNPEYALSLLDSVKRIKKDMVLDLYTDYIDEGWCNGARSSWIRHCDTVMPENVTREYKKADVLLSIGNNPDIAKKQKPSKVNEYISTGKPVVHIASIADDPINVIVRKYPNGLAVSQTDSFEKNVELLVDFFNRVRDMRRVDSEELHVLYPKASPSYIASKCALLVRE